MNKKTLISIALITIALLALTVPFCNKAFHIDDPLFIWMAKHIHSHPFDPYGFSVVWYYIKTPLYVTMNNPPLVSYYIAAVAHLSGWGEKGLHLAFLVPAIFVAIGTYLLGRRFSSHPLFASALALSTPVFLISCTNIMADITMLGFWIWAIYLWIRGVEENRHTLLLFAVLFAILCYLTKYYGMAILLLMFVFAFIKKRRFGLWTIYLSLSLIPLVLYQVFTKAVYGRGLLSCAARDAICRISAQKILTQTALGLVFFGGCLLTLVFFLAVLSDKKTFFIQAAIFAVLIIFILPLYSQFGWLQAAESCLFAWLGINLIIFTLSEMWKKRRDAEIVTLALWVIITFCFASFINWCVTGRSILPAIPAVSILLVRRIECRFKQRSLAFRRLWLLMVPAVIISLGIVYADYTLANTARTAAIRICADYKDSARKIWFEGHWGFQYYMEASGAYPAEADKAALEFKPGDILVVPENNSNLFPLAPDMMASLVETIKLEPFGYTSTINRFLHTAFYSGTGVSLPFVFGAIPPEHYYILRIEPWSYLDPLQNTANHINDTEKIKVKQYTEALFSLYNPKKLYLCRKLYLGRSRVYRNMGEDKKALSDYIQAMIIWPHD